MAGCHDNKGGVSGDGVHNLATTMAFEAVAVRGPKEWGYPEWVGYVAPSAAEKIYQLVPSGKAVVSQVGNFGRKFQRLCHPVEGVLVNKNTMASLDNMLHEIIGDVPFTLIPENAPRPQAKLQFVIASDPHEETSLPPPGCAFVIGDVYYNNGARHSVHWMKLPSNYRNFGLLKEIDRRMFCTRSLSDINAYLDIVGPDGVWHKFPETPSLPYYLHHTSGYYLVDSVDGE